MADEGNVEFNNKNNVESNNKSWKLFLEELSGETNHAYFDPIDKNFSSIQTKTNFPVQCLSSGYDWLLLLSRKHSELFFFNPSTRAKIVLPYRTRLFDVATFTAPPDSPNCIVYALERPLTKTCLHIEVLRVGDSEWRNFTYESKGFGTFKQTVYHEGHLYCTDSIGRFGDYDVSKGTWNVLREMKCSILRDSFLLEFHGVIFALVRGPYGGFGGFYKLKFDQNNVVDLEEVKELGNATFSVGHYDSCSSSSSTSSEGEESKDFFFGYRCVLKCEIFDGSDCGQGIVFEATKFALHYTPVWTEPLN